jgi:AAA family ATP:ADP antiporter
VMIVERAVTFAIANPALRVLFTVVPAEDKYKAQNFIDTVVFRGGDAASGWLFGSLAKALGLGMSTLALVTVPLAVAWTGLSLTLGRRQAELANEDLSSRGEGRGEGQTLAPAIVAAPFFPTEGFS